jgi:hypothetical protein
VQLCASASVATSLLAVSSSIRSELALSKLAPCQLVARVAQLSPSAIPKRLQYQILGLNLQQLSIFPASYQDNLYVGDRTHDLNL